jgi:hypothetical protein|uniref:Uncharacterized protein n=1 Tax=viral metagenome TaxID=1070528 RepID=A0A6C0BJW3_9ZZZZ
MSFEWWKNDTQNQQLEDRTFFDLHPIPNYLFPATNETVNHPLLLNLNTKTNQKESLIYDSSHIRSIPVENTLFDIDHPLHRDELSCTEEKQLIQTQHVSNHTLYQRYHTHEIHSLCFPNTDMNVWNNPTKAYYNTPENRNQKT